MMQDTISKIESRLQNSGSLPDNTRAELLHLLAQLKLEVARLAATHAEQAQSIASFAEVSAFEAMREKKNPASLAHSIGGMESSVTEFEASHPQLVAVVNRLSNMLSNMGI
ncbi:MAG TPA: DUF4404 family protein [Verrucomicrobiae bacterium]|nr:DUF4404 family protein [Verrucomicrobiae bacterium]